MTRIPAPILERVKAVKVVPVLVIPSVEQAVPLAKALITGGIDILEVTLRTPCALDAIKAIADAKLDCLVGAGTITRASEIEATLEAGSQFIVTPGTTPELADSLSKTGIPVFPGVSTVSESLAMRDAGFEIQKFFPAEAAGGANFLKSISGPVPDVKFMPTGGIKLETAPNYLALSNVLSVGGSWVAPDALIKAGDWSGIEQLARDTKEKLS